MEERSGSRKMLARSTHRKSRRGCLECKRRRVKCDELKPECHNCTRRSLVCHYNPMGSRATSSSPQCTGSISTATEGPDLEDLHLWHHWLTVAASTCPDDENSSIMWRENIPRIALKHRHVAQLVLALSALHLARTEVSERHSYLTKSTALQTSAMSGMMAALSDVPSSGCTSALYVAAILLCFCSLGKGPSPGQYLVYADEGVPPWMDLLNGVKEILSQHKHIITGVAVESEDGPGEPVKPEVLMPGYSKAIADLTQHISVLCAEDISFQKYTQSLEALQSSFETAFEHKNGKTKTNFHFILAWMYRIGEDFQVALQERRPIALVILAHYMVIFAKLERLWFVEGWAMHIMDSVKRDLHPAYQRWLDWPISQL